MGWISKEYKQDVPRRSQDVPKRPQDASKTPQDSQVGPKKAPRHAQDAPRTLQDTPQEQKIRSSIWDRKAISSGIPSRPRFWIALGSIFGGFAIDFWGVRWVVRGFLESFEYRFWKFFAHQKGPLPHKKQTKNRDFRRDKKLQNTRASAASERAQRASEQSDGTTEATRNNTKLQETHKKQTRFPFLT